MEKSSRRRFFYFLIAAFIIIAPVLIAYSWGYRFSIERKEVEQKGGIFIKSRLPRLAVFIDNQFVKETPVLAGGSLLTGVDPGAHLLRLEKEGYTPWTKSVAVEPALVTELRNILLVPEKITPATSTPKEILEIERRRSTDLSPLNAGATTSLGFIALDAGGALVARTGTTTKIIVPNVHSFSYTNGVILFVDKNGFLAKYYIPENRTEILGRPGFFLGGEAPLSFIHLPDGGLAILDGAGGLYIFNADGAVTKTVAGNILKMRLDSRGEKALLLKEFEIKVLWLKDNPYQPFQKAGTVENIMTLQRPILDARWLFLNNAHVILRTEEGIFITELDGRGGRYSAELWRGPADEIFTSAEIPNAVFFRRDKVWFKIDL